jgi:hypothetical protein
MDLLGLIEQESFWENAFVGFFHNALQFYERRL